jgi:hypothetical protein
VKRPYQITGALLALFGAFMVREALMLRFYTAQGPGPGLLPVFISIMVTILGAVMLYQATFGTPEPMPEDFFPDRDGVFRVVGLTLASVGLLVLLPHLGFILTTMLFLAVVLRVIGRQSLVTTALVAVVGSLAVFYAFDHWLQVPLPKGVFVI